MVRNLRPVCRIGATLGEGPAWVSREGALWLVDIKQQKLHRFDPAIDRLQSWDAPAPVGWVLPARAGDFVVGLKTGLARFSPESGAFTPITDPEPHLPGNRLNDATTDRDGRIWFGTMDDAETEPTGQLHVCDAAGARACAVPAAVITNGPAFSPDGRTLYHTDTLGRMIYAIPVNDDGALGPPAPFVEIEADAGYPDGPTVDSDGCVWTGLFRGWAVRRYAPDGKLIAVVPFPTANVTKIAFGGNDLKTAYATTACKGLTPEELAAQPAAGDLFAFDVDTPGLPLMEAAF